MRWHWLILLLTTVHAYAQKGVRVQIPLNTGWISTATDSNQVIGGEPYAPSIRTTGWQRVNLPHNWDAYHGHRRYLHGNRHGDSWYRRSFNINKPGSGKRVFLFFEGVGSYAYVYVNGKYAGHHSGGRTSFTLDITELLNVTGAANLLAVRAWHPSNIQDQPWVCGGCSDERGFSEGSQPMGIFRPVHLMVTSDVRIEPFGIHGWSGSITADHADLNVNCTIRNYSARQRNIRVQTSLIDQTGRRVTKNVRNLFLRSGDSLTVMHDRFNITLPHLWQPGDPYLYQIESRIYEGERLLDSLVQPYGFRTISWPIGRKAGSNQFFLNGDPVFINGIAEYEHLLGSSHAFSKEQIVSRMKWIRDAGFNALRDAHQPHNLLYGQLCNEMGILWWSQLSAHVWYDTPEFRKQFLASLREWVIERRNEPSLILWGLQNESRLPADFARECTELIRALDPTAAAQRLVTTCNGGEGTDWDVPQNWTGTYGGDPSLYGEDLKKQLLVGEYGAWRTLGLHTEGGYRSNGPLSEDRMTALMEQKVRLAESVRDSVCGQFFWLLTSHDNPGRVQGGEAYREMDRLGPVNYKGLLTPWEEPADVYYMFRANYTSSPMVYIASHSWPSRWTKPGVKDSIIIYSNCDEVELFNGSTSLGRKHRGPIGTHFQWDNVNIQYNQLSATGYVSNKARAADTILLNHLPAQNLPATQPGLHAPAKGYTYVERVNCGGPAYKDAYGSSWRADAPDISESWTKQFPEMPFAFASQRKSFDLIHSKDPALFQHFRYGREALRYKFKLANGNYRVELYFMEPWLGRGGTDGSGHRLFDVAINGRVVINDLDIWSEAGLNTVLRKVVEVPVTDGLLHISFPEVKAGQAVISAIAIATRDHLRPTERSHSDPSWLDLGDAAAADHSTSLSALPSVLFGSNRLFPDDAATIPADNELFIAVPEGQPLPSAYAGFEKYKEQVKTEDKRFDLYRTITRSPQQLPADGLLKFYQPQSKMPPAFDLKPVISYRINTARLMAGMRTDSLNGRLVAIAEAEDAVIEFPLTTGVADRYSITIRYYHPGQDTVAVTFGLSGTGGSVMPAQSANLIYTRPGKWNTVTIDTQNMINAGNYIFRIGLKRGKGIAISGIDIQ